VWEVNRVVCSVGRDSLRLQLQRSVGSPFGVRLFEEDLELQDGRLRAPADRVAPRDVAARRRPTARRALCSPADIKTSLFESETTLYQDQFSTTIFELIV